MTPKDIRSEVLLINTQAVQPRRCVAVLAWCNAPTQRDGYSVFLERRHL